MKDHHPQIVTYQLPIVGRIWIHSFELAIGFTAMVSGFVQLIHHDDGPQSVHTAIGDLSWVWNIGYTLSGALVLAGFFRKNPRAESGGLMIFATALLIQALSLFTLHLDIWAIVPSVVLLTSLALASVARVYYLVAQLSGHIFITPEVEGVDDSSP